MNVHLHASFRLSFLLHSSLSPLPKVRTNLDTSKALSQSLRRAPVVPIPNKAALTQNHKGQKLVKESNFQVHFLLTSQHPCDTEFLNQALRLCRSHLDWSQPSQNANPPARAMPRHSKSRLPGIHLPTKTPHCPTTDLLRSTQFHSVFLSFHLYLCLFGFRFQIFLS